MKRPYLKNIPERAPAFLQRSSKIMRAMKTFLLIAIFIATTRTLFASTKIDEIGTEALDRVEEYDRQSKLRLEARRQLLEGESFATAKYEEKQVQIETLRIQLEEKERKRIRQSITYNTDYYDNYFNESRGLEKETIVFFLSPKTQLDLGGKRIKLNLDYSNITEVPARFPENLVTRFEQTGNASYSFPLGKRLKYMGTASVNRGKSRASAQLQNFSLRTAYAVKNELEYYLSRFFSLGLEHRWDEQHNSASSADSSDSRKHIVNGKVYYNFSRFTGRRLLFQAGHGHTRGGNGRFKNLNYAGYVGLEGPMTDFTSASAKIGYLFHDAKADRDDEKFVWEIAVRRRLPFGSREISVDITTGQFIANALDITSGTFIVPVSAGLSTSLTWSPKLAFSAGINGTQVVSKTETRALDGSDGLESNTSISRTMGTNMGFRYNIRSYLQLSFQYKFDFGWSNESSQRRNHTYLTGLRLSG